MSVILATAGYDHTIRFWEAPSGICSLTLRHSDSQVNCLEITPDKQFLAAGGNPQIRLYDINNPSSSDQPVLTLEGHTAAVTSVGFQRDGRYLYSGSEDGTVKLWDLRSPSFARSFDSKGPVNSVSLRVDRDEIVSGDQNGSVKLWDLGQSSSSSTTTASNGGGCLNQVTPDISSCGKAIAIQAVDISDGSSSSSSPFIIAVSNHANVYVWDPTKSSTTWRPITKFRAHPVGSYCLHAKISPDGRHLCTTSSDGSAKLWDTHRWILSQSLQQHTKWVWDAAFCADSSYLVTASSDKTAQLYNLRTGDVVRQYHGHQSAVTCVALNDSSV